MKWIRTEKLKPKNGSLVLIKTRKQTCACGGYEDREVYFDDGIFHGIQNQRWVDKWAYSPNNDILTEVQKQMVMPLPCKNCVV